MLFKNKCLLIRHNLNVVKSSFHTLMNGNGLNNASGTYYRNWWFPLLCIPAGALFPFAARIPLFSPKSQQKGNPRENCGSVGWQGTAVLGTLLFPMCLCSSATKNHRQGSPLHKSASNLRLTVSWCSLITDLSYFIAFMYWEKLLCLHALTVPLPYPGQGK